MTDQDLAKRVYGGFDALSPTKEVEQRSLDAVLQAQTKKSNAGGRVFRPWWIAVPAAACVVALLVTVGIRNVQMPQASAPAVATDTQAQKAQESPIATDGATGGYAAREESLALEGEADEAAPLAADAASPTGDTAASSSEYPLVTLESGETMRVGAQLSEAPSYKSVASASANDASGKRSTDCVVADGRYVLFPNKDVWYELLPYGE